MILRLTDRTGGCRKMSAFYSFGDTPLAGVLRRIISQLQGSEGELSIFIPKFFSGLPRGWSQNTFERPH